LAVALCSLALLAAPLAAGAQPTGPVRLFLKRALRQTKAVIITAEDAEAALDLLAYIRPDLILECGALSEECP
jgi:hypothetical protein